MQILFNVFNGDRDITLGVVFIFIVFAYVLILSWRKHKFSSETRRAIERMRSLERRQPPELELEPASLHEIEINRTDNFCFWSEPKQTAGQKLLPEDPTDGQAAPCDLPLEPGNRQRLPLEAGTKVQAARNFGPINEGTLGIITGVAEVSFFGWPRPTYVCTFAENKKVYARPRQIAVYEHGYTIEELEQPDFASNLSRQMTLRAQQLFQGPRSRPLRSTQRPA